MRRSLFIAAFVAGFAGGCFLRPVPAPGFRSACKTDNDCQALDCKGNSISLDAAAALIVGCDDPAVLTDPTKGLAFRQTCVADLCEYSCTLATFATDCPETEGFQFCLNNVCATICGAGDPAEYDIKDNDGFCTSPQTCIPFGEGGVDLGQFGALSGALSQGFSRLPEGAGLCGTRCDARDAQPCAPGEYCGGALCLPDCSNPEATPCGDGSICLAFGGFSSCLVTCDPAQTGACGTGEICVAGINICQPSCIGEDPIVCADGFYCDPDLGICLPPGEDATTDDATTDDATTADATTAGTT
ncbi:MAG: hypothetical protein H0T76_00665 [Nannocystis sp.]|nr:hypothetical protein [Nannocystis sp.]MBA3544972.1 hypothetical protein [Nannocystis sp.]